MEKAYAEVNEPQTKVTSQVSKNESTSVSSWEELKTALENKSITDITLTADIQIGSTIIYSAADTIKNIHGNGHLINANRKQIGMGGKNAKVLVEDAIITNTGSHGLFWSTYDNVEVTYRNIKHSGYSLADINRGTLNLEGTVDSSSILNIAITANSLVVAENSKVNIIESALVVAVHLTDSSPEVVVPKGAEVSISSPLTAIQSGLSTDINNYGTLKLKGSAGLAINLLAGGTVRNYNNSTMVAEYSNAIHSAILVTNGSFIADNGSTVIAKPIGKNGTLLTGNKTIFNEESNFSIKNNSSLGSALGSYALKTHVSIASNNGIDTWDRSSIGTPIPTSSYSGALTAEFDLLGYLNSTKQTNLTSNNSEFLQNFVTGEIGQINGGSFVEGNITEPVLNVINDRDIQLTGFGVPGAVINIYIEGKMLGTTTVDSDGRWVLSLEKPLQSGTKEEASQVIEGKESNKVSQVVSHIDAETINFFKYGYLQPYGLILEGSIDNGDVDLTNKDLVKKTMNLVDSSGKIVSTTALENQDWYHPGIFNGYQAILDNDMLSTLQSGEYKVTITLTVGEFTETKDLNVSGAKYVGHTIFDQIESLNTGKNTVKTLNKEGIGYLKVSNN